MKRVTTRRTFQEICRLQRQISADRLANKATIANRLAKICPSPQFQRLAYERKCEILNHGTSLGLFKLRSDENARNHLLSVVCGARRLHLPVHKLSYPNTQLKTTKALFGQPMEAAA